MTPHTQHARHGMEALSAVVFATFKRRTDWHSWPPFSRGYWHRHYWHLSKLLKVPCQDHFRLWLSSWHDKTPLLKSPKSENSCRSGGKRCTTCMLRDSSPNAIKADSTKRPQSRLNQTPSKQAQPNAFKADSTKRLQSRLNQTPSKQTQPNAIKAVIQGRGREAPTLRAPLSGTFLQILPDLVTPVRGHSLSPRSCPATRSAPSERFGY